MEVVVEMGGFWGAHGRVGRERRLRILLLDAIPLFRLCSARELEALADSAAPAQFGPGEVLCAEGEPSNVCYVIAAGEALVTLEGRPVTIVGPDDIVGERGLLFDVPRGATVSALSHMLVYAIDATALRALAERNPTLAAAMRADIEHRYGAIDSQ